MKIMVPSTFGLNERDPRLQAQRFGTIARAAAIFGVDHVHIYKDKDQQDEKQNAELMAKYLSYAECPPYLRKQLIPYDEDLQYASIMPPLQTLAHGYTNDFREAAVIESGGGSATVNAGLDESVTVPGEFEVDTRITIMKTEEGWIPVDPSDIEGFWTFTVTNDRRPLGPALQDEEGVVIGTSADGDHVDTFLDSPHATRDDLVIVFGSAWRGIPALIDRGDCSADDFAGMYNTIPGQHTRTVRTDEAVLITLGILNTVTA